MRSRTVDHAQTGRERRQRPPVELPQLSPSLPTQLDSYWPSPGGETSYWSPAISRRAGRASNFHDGQQRLKVKLETELQSWAGLAWPRGACPALLLPASKDKREIKSLLSVIDKRYCCPMLSKVKQKLKSKLFPQTLDKLRQETHNCSSQLEGKLCCTEITRELIHKY